MKDTHKMQSRERIKSVPKFIDYKRRKLFFNFILQVYPLLFSILSTSSSAAICMLQMRTKQDLGSTSLVQGSFVACCPI